MRTVGERGGDVCPSVRRFNEPRLLFVFSATPVTHGDRGGPRLIGDAGSPSSAEVAGRMGGFGKLMRRMAEYTSEPLSPLNGLIKVLGGIGGALMERPSSCPMVLVPTATLVEVVDMTVDLSLDGSTLGGDSDEFQCGLTEFMTFSQAIEVLGTADARADTSPMLNRGEEDPRDAAVIWDWYEPRADVGASEGKMSPFASDCGRRYWMTNDSAS